MQQAVAAQVTAVPQGGEGKGGEGKGAGGKSGAGKSAGGKSESGAAQGGKAAPESSYRFRPMPIPKVVIEHRGLRRIAVDGALDDWPKVVPIGLRDPRQVSGTALGAYRGINDISGQVYMLWDEAHLFVAVQVLDEWHRPLNKQVPLRQEIPPVDNVQITFDPKRDTQAAGSDPGRRDDTTFYLADLEEIGDGLIQWDRLRANKALTPGAKCVVTRREQDGITLYEARIPWQAILPHGTKAARGVVLDLQVILNDYDDVLDQLPQTRVGWNFGMGPQILPGMWGSLMLMQDFDAERDDLPRFPKTPEIPWGMPERADWVKLYNGIQATPPTFATATTVDPALAGGAERHQLLVELEGHLESYPRLDNVDLHHRIQRRMSREVAGLMINGLPFFWKYATDDVLRRAERAPAAGTLRLFRMPHGGWYVRSSTVNFVIDPCGLEVERLYIKSGIDFAILTRPTEVTRRQEPLLIRMSASKIKRQFFTHLDFVLTGAQPGSMTKVKPYVKYLMGGLDGVTPLGKLTASGEVTLSYGYLVRWPDGRTLVVAGLSLGADELVELKKLVARPDVLIISGKHEAAEQVAKSIGARHTILDDVFVASEYPTQFGGRYTYSEALRLQSQMKPLSTLVLAPGESIDLK
jgi:hypothetical protein